MEYITAQWIFIFFVYCFLGWVFESTWMSLNEKRLVNRGFLRGPVLPIYGCGALLMLSLHFLTPYPAGLFFAGLAIATVFEYIVGVIMENLFHVKYWDYSNQKFQFQGKICLSSSLTWGGMTCLLNYGFHDTIGQKVLAVPEKTVAGLDVLFCILFAADILWSVHSALGLAKVLQEMEKLQQEAENLRRQIAQNAMEKRQALRENFCQLRQLTQEELLQKGQAIREDAQEQKARLEESRVQLHLALREAETHMEEKMSGLKWSHRSLLQGNPHAVSSLHSKGMQAIRRRLGK